LFKASLLAATLASALGAQAAGLGKLTVYSAIGQPLNAEVSLMATPEELPSLAAKLGSHDAFKEAGIELMPALAGLRFNVVKLPNNQAVLKLTTERPLNEAFLHFLVELNWTSGRMVREYTFLLDPPEMLQAAKPASVVSPVAPLATPAAQVLSVSAQVAPQPVPAQAGSAAAKPRPVAAAPAAGEQVQVKAGDTLSKIARESKPESVSLDQMLVALFNSNRDAFDGNNMNRLRAGKILRIPDAAEAVQVDAGEARKLVVGQAADFNAYRRRLAAATQAAPAAEAAPQQQVAGKIKPQIEEKAPPAPAKDKLEVSRTEAVKTAKAGKGSLEEDLIARDKALREAADRIADLEKNLENLKKLVELKSQPGAQAQQQAQAVAPKPTEAKQPEPVAPKPAVEPAKAPEPAEGKPEAPAPVVAEKPAEQPAPEPQAAPAKPADAAAPAPKPEARKPLPPPPPPPEPSFTEDNPELVFGGGGLLALLLGYFGYNAWRRKKLARDEAASADEPSVSASDLASKSGALFGAASESVDSGEVSIQGDFSEGGALTTEESVDPVAEADVYMAYGRDSQAEEILLEGIKTDPTRSAIHLKLLELYANRKSVDQFQDIARQLHDLNDGQGSDWEKAEAMARSLGIDGGLFAVAAPAAAVPEPQEAEPVAAEAPDAAMATVVTHEDEAVVEAPQPAAEEAASLDFDLDLGTTSRPAAPVETPVAQQAPAADEAMSLDFDFDLGSAEPAVAEAAPAPAVAEAEPAVEDNVVDFSLDTGSSEEAPVAAAEPAAEAESVAPGNGIDFDLDLGSGAAPAEEDLTAVAAPEAVEAAEIELPAGGLAEAAAEPAPAPAGALGDLKLDFDLDLGSEPAPAPVEEAKAVAETDLGGINLDLGEAEEQPAASLEEAAPVEMALPEVELPAAETIPPAPDAGGADIDFDLALDAGLPASQEGKGAQMGEAGAELPGIELDVAVPEVGAGEAEPLASLPDIDLAAEPDAEQGETAAVAEVDDPEVATKLELAQAYEEMGDREGARELLNEVLNEGSSAQQEMARARLDQLDA
jgi:pilus assembly protein FimV